MPAFISRESSWTGSATVHTEQISTQGNRHPACFLTVWLEMSQEAHTQSGFQIPRGTRASCNAKLAFPGKSTQEPQRGGRSSYDADSRLTAHSLLFFYFYGFLFLKKVVWTQQNFCLQTLLHKSNWIRPIHHCFPEQLKQQPKQG